MQPQMKRSGFVFLKQILSFFLFCLSLQIVRSFLKLRKIAKPLSSSLSSRLGFMNRKPGAGAVSWGEGVRRGQGSAAPPSRFQQHYQVDGGAQCLNRLALSQQVVLCVLFEASRSFCSPL